MCGRFTLTVQAEILRDLFELETIPDLTPRYNIAPTQEVAAVRQTEQGSRELVRLRWGLIPSWADSPAVGVRMLNARSETVAGKPAFRSAFRQRRCLIPADGFFEWQNQMGRKQPFYFRLRDGKPFALAGLWEHWQQGARIIESCTVLTTEANEIVRPLHERMPVILPPSAYETWLDPKMQRTEVLLPLLAAYPAGEMIAHPVNMRVNSPRNDDEECVQSVA